MYPHCTCTHTSTFPSVFHPELLSGDSESPVRNIGQSYSNENDINTSATYKINTCKANTYYQLSMTVHAK